MGTDNDTNTPPEDDSPRDDKEQDDLDELKKNDIPLAILEAVDLVLPTVYEDEIFGQDLLEVVGAYHKTNSQLKAYRHASDTAGADKSVKQMGVLRAQAAWIQHEHPNTVPIYKELAAIKAAEMAAARKRLVEAFLS